jgi:Cysteine-rich CWC
MIASVELREQRCEACGRDFGCGADAAGCWCERIELDRATLARLREISARCLCPACLGAIAHDTAMNAR